MPQYKFSLTYEAEISEELSSSTEYEMNYRHWIYIEKSSITEKTFNWDIPILYYKPRCVIIGFQKKRNDKISTNNGRFDLYHEISKMLRENM